MYKKIDISERQLEELIRKHSGLIEEGMSYISHQNRLPNGRLDVLLIDSGKSLVVGELKVVEDDAMLMQCLDYYDL
ncbi:endonuclease NucS [Methylomonas sp. EFPC3]|uniref:endonuclease NucS domain-containing protein n=1 Tax=Methylomonas sp. EFPC3 TaxID=3021710 RepID=UPI002415F054|nr:endonuclease NucS domain-containing protein [Methylomonas sp. EFPC3]WFP50237.1 endonuclease NucS [Methylomonas sp. EFPC3]